MASGNHVSMVRYLYKSILRLHKGMPVEFRALGDQYTREEFKRHKNCEKAEADKFMLEWTVSHVRKHFIMSSAWKMYVAYPVS